MQTPGRKKTVVTVANGEFTFADETPDKVYQFCSTLCPIQSRSSIHSTQIAVQKT